MDHLSKKEWGKINVLQNGPTIFDLTLITFMIPIFKYLQKYPQ